jgi:hypothetical protein
MNWGGEGTYLEEEEFEGLDYGEIRSQALEYPEELGKEILEDSGTAVAYAADSAAEGLSLQDFLRDEADDRVEEEAARFIWYELTEEIRRNTLKQMDEDMDAFQAVIVDGNTPEEQLQRAFFVVDRKQGGYIDLRPEDIDEEVEPERYPKSFVDEKTSIDDRLAPLDEADEVSPESIGALNLSGLYVMSDDWIMYRNGKKPLGVDKEIREEVYDFLDELGVAR